MNKIFNFAILAFILLCAPPSQAVPPLEEHSFVSPTELFIMAHGLDEMKEGFKINGVSYKFHILFEEAQARESVGFFGYHGSCRDFRIYQDLIRIGIEEILQIPVRYDFHFMRIPGDPAYDLKGAFDFLHLYQAVDDLTPDHAAKLLSLQIALYNECEYASGSCPTEFFTKNSSLTAVHYPKKIKAFFKMLGIDSKSVREAFKIGRQHLPDDRGILIQFFDVSHLTKKLALYDLLDRHAYASFPLGVPLPGGKTPSDYIQSHELRNYPQLRLVMSNSHTLNPKSQLQIKRYDGIPKGQIKEYEEALRLFFQKQKVDASQCERYRQLLEKLWK